MRKPINPLIRLFLLLNKCNNNGCWLFTGKSKTYNGYGVFYNGEKKERVHIKSGKYWKHIQRGQ
jgi:hypothetical protein